MNMHKEAEIREPLILGNKTYGQITRDVVAPVEGKANKWWYLMFTIASLIALWGLGCITYTIGVGIGTWGLNTTVGWAWDITNFVWWVGIGHAGTLISAVLLLFRQKWRMAINRSAEAMTIFAVMMAALFPGIHMGRIWMAYWVLPLPNQFGSLWVNFNSPLLWDVFAISTYFTVSLVFWYIGLIPDFATVRDRAVKPLSKKIYSFLSFGWTGNAKAWIRFEEVSLVLAGLATPLVFSVHSIVSMDFATSVIPGWHTTIFPPYFVAGAIFSGFAMVQTLLLIVRKVVNLEDYITVKHVEYMNIVIVITGSMVGVAYLSELFISWYSGVEYEGYAFLNRATGPYSWSYYWMMSCNVITPQLFWIRKIRRSLVLSFILSIVVNIGMWFERFVIIVTSLHRDYIPSSWDDFHPTFVDLGIFIGTIGIFFVLFLLYSRVFPVLALNELKTIVKSSGEGYKNGNLKVELPTLPTQGTGSPKVEAPKVEEKPEPTPTPAPAKSEPEASVQNTQASKAEAKDDLTKIEGIGPKINEILNTNGILNFLQLSQTDTTKIKEILVAAGPRYQIHDPATWPKQASLAAEGKWEELKEWQDKLDGGKE
ncbi:MAG: polysulfide reductase NrfD [Flavobacteriales bacterium]|nr:polysulfide reductase NrfD [Flavobacteriales bacterium]